MKIFISWAGNQSKYFAEALKEFLEGCFQNIETFFSEDDIPKGENWSKKLLEELATSDYCLICLTKDSLNSQWINFEAGVMASNNAKVSAILCDIKNEDLKGPLSLFEATKLEEKDFSRLIKNINEIEQVKSPVLEKSFKLFYDEFQRKIEAAPDFESKNSSINIDKNIKELLKYAKNNYDFLVRFDSVMPAVTEQVTSIKQVNFQKKYGVVFDCIFNFIFELAHKPDDYFKDINNRYVIDQVLILMESIMSKDRYAKSRLDVLISNIKSKMNIFSYNLKNTR